KSGSRLLSPETVILLNVADLPTSPSTHSLSITALSILASPVTWSLWTSRASSMSLLICAGFQELPSQYHWRKASPAESTWTQRSPSTTPSPDAGEVERVMEFLPLADAVIFASTCDSSSLDAASAYASSARACASAAACSAASASVTS